ncbi:MAG: hypothetical protein ACF8XB_25745 [Planctomycetota bacterium JB042]
MNPLRSLLSVLLLVAALPACMGIGKAGADLELEEPTLDVLVETDAARYGVGEAIVATVVLTNAGAAPVSIPRPSPDTVRFFVRGADESEPRDTQSVRWPLEQAEFISLEPGESHGRRFVLNLATSAPGSLDLFAVYRTEPDPAIELAANVASKPVALEVELPVAMERDSMGLISRAEAERIAVAHFGREAARTEALLVKDSKVRMHQWWVTVWYQSASPDGNMYGSCFIDPYRGRVRGVTDDPVPSS